MNPYDLPVDAARARMLSPAVYRFCRSEASLVRSAPVTLVPFLRVSVTPSSRRTEAAADCRLPRSVSGHDHARTRDRLPTRQQKIGTIDSHRRAYLWPHAMEAVRARGSSKRDEVSQVSAPEVLDAIREQHDPFRTERVHGALVVRDEHDRPAVAAKCRQDLGT